ncbi:Sel1 domain-containing protein [Trypanosoma grayi]|uniref:Sel1 domain-containing protein n=1 Tax=Trypanosoma grayi TaxID=71804 RepID=UPI0004F45D37|nr:Sel1 domain-containing protein [Trypanosoma grayi]KEG11587.1 Sel1 domain-containing protein [Trypanosoma grayi]
MTRTAVSVNTSAGLNTPSMLHATRPLKAPTNRPLPRQRDHAAVPTVLVPAADASASPPTAVVPRRKDLEERLQYLLLVEDRLTPAIVEDDVRQVIAELRRRRGERKAVVPPVRRASGAAGGVRPHVLALVQACEASSDAAAVEGLRAFHRSHYVHQGNEVGRSLVFTALAELLLMRRERSSDDVQEALSMLDVAVGDRHVGAMLQVGICLRDGLGVPRDLVAAITWIERAADAGYAPAMFELAVMYDDGVEDSSRCLESDWGEAMKWYRCAAELGHTMAQLNLGKLLWRAATAASDGGGGDSAIITGLQKRAREFLERAASAGNEEAVRLLRYR